MTTSLDERIAKSKAHTAKLEQLRRAEQRKKRDAEKKKNQRRNYIIGEYVTKYFPEIMDIEPGTKVENAIRFKPLEEVLSALSTNSQLLNLLSKKNASNASSVNQKEKYQHSNSRECVSGHQQNSEEHIR